MQIIFYLLIALTAFYTGSIDKRLKISRSGIVTTPLAALSVVGIVIMCYVLFGTWLPVFLLMLSVLRQTGGGMIKIIAAFTGIFLIAAVSLALGPCGWAVLTSLSMLAFLLLVTTAESITTEIYTVLLKEMVQALRAARKTADSLRHMLPYGLRWLVSVVEIPVVCSLAVAGVWQMMNWLYTPPALSGTEVIFRLAVIAPLTSLLYYAYLRDTVETQNAEVAEEAESSIANALTGSQTITGSPAI